MRSLLASWRAYGSPMKLFRLHCGYIVIALAACGGSEKPPPPTETRAVRISAYGEGTISDAQGPIPCESHECEKSYVVGTQVVLAATPKPGWRFERWSGCEAVTSEKCTIAILGDRLVAPVFLRTVETKLQSNVRSMVALDDASVLKYDAGVLTLAKTAPVLAGLQVGDILHSQGAGGLARRVMKIVDIPGGATIIDTADVAITDVVAQGSYYFNSKSKAGASAAAPDRRKALQFVPLHPGVRPQAAWNGDLDVRNTIDVNIAVDARTSIKGAIDITLNLEGAIDIAFPGVLQEFRFVVNPTIEPKLGFEGDFGKSEGDIPLLAFTGAPIVLGPVVLVPEFVVKLVFKGEVTLEVSYISSYVTTGSAGFSYLKGHGVRKIWTTKADPAPFNPAGKGTVSFDMMGALEMGLKIWGVAGPKVEVGPYFNIEGSLDTTDDCAKVEAEIGVRGRVGGEIKLVSWELGEWEWVIAELPLWKLLDRPLSAGCGKLPAAPTGIAARPRGPGSMELSWVAPPARESVVAYEIYRQGRMVTRVSETTFIDSGLVPGSEYCYDVRSRDIDSKLSAAGEPVCGRTGLADTQPPSAPVISGASAESTTSARVVWSPSNDNIGVVRYAVLVNDVVVDSTAGFSLSMRRLAPSTSYCFKVRAYDAAGNASVDSASSCTTTLAPNLAAWTLMLKCVNQSIYIVSKRIDIDLQSPNNVSSTGEVQDYDGDHGSFHLFGGYDSAKGAFSGRVNWIFAGNQAVREDEFALALNAIDTGDVAMNQITANGGCTAAIRLVRN